VLLIRLMIAVFLMAVPDLAVAASASRSTMASWYGARWDGRPTASGEPFNHRRFTAASRYLPMGTRIQVTRGERRVVVRVNDRGPYIRGRGLDLSEAAARSLGIREQGVARVQYRIISRQR
jgi:rare lipoprotein A